MFTWNALFQLDEVPALADQPIREFGAPVANMLAVLAHGETGGVAELTAVHLYLNNAYGTVLMHRVPPGPVTTAAEMAACRDRARAVHAALLAALRTFRGTWCGDRDVEAQHRAKYRAHGFADVAAAVRGSAADAADLVRGLNVAAGARTVRLDFAPERLALARYTARLAADRFAADALVAGLLERRFAATYEFDPRALYDGYLRGTVFGTAYAVFYWTAVAHVRLAERYADADAAGPWPPSAAAAFASAFRLFARPLAVFRGSLPTFADPLSARAADTVARLHRFVVRLSDDLSKLAAAAPDETRNALAAARPKMRDLVGRLCADAVATVPGLTEPPPPEYFDAVATRDDALRLMRTNRLAFARLVAATAGHADDRANLIRLKRFFFYSTEAVGFHGHD